MVKKRLEGKDNLTPWQKYLEKKKEKRILKKKRKVIFALATWGGAVVGLVFGFRCCYSLVWIN